MPTVHAKRLTFGKGQQCICVAVIDGKDVPIHNRVQLMAARRLATGYKAADGNELSMTFPDEFLKTAVGYYL